VKAIFLAIVVLILLSFSIPKNKNNTDILACYRGFFGKALNFSGYLHNIIIWPRTALQNVSMFTRVVIIKQDTYDIISNRIQ